MINRKKDIDNVKELLELFPATAILGARQCGKTTLAKQFPVDHYFDLENPRDLVKFDNPQLLLEDLRGLIVIDEIQRKPDLFPLLRYLIDNDLKKKFLILGSASGKLMRQSSESLAGRIAYYRLGGLRLSDVGFDNIDKLWLTGSFPKAFTSKTNSAAFLWLDNYISTFLERDIPQLGINIPAVTLRRFWIMLSHYHAQVLNYSEIANSFGVSDHTVRKYIDILSGTFMIRVLHPWYVNIGKRLVKRPKIYFRDSGVFHDLLSVNSNNNLLEHNKLGASWEGFALEIIANILEKRDQELFFWRTHSGSEVDLFWQDSGKNLAIEFKFSDAPKLNKSMKTSIEALDLSHLWVVYPGKDIYKLNKKITVIPLKKFEVEFNNYNP